jgi:hypothetical protein
MEVGAFHEICRRYGVRPTYLVDAPVVEDRAAAQLLRRMQDDGECEIGAHVHPWCNPPGSEEPVNERDTYLCNLSPPLQQAKIEWLTDAIENRFGRRPTSFRAGRYGFGLDAARVLGDLGYEVDSSVIPFTDYSSSGGPDFSDAPTTPYFLDGESVTVPHARGFLYEAPVSVGFNRADFARADAIQRLAGRPWLRRLRAAGALDRLGIVRRIKFSPEQADLNSLRRLADVYAARSAPAIVLMFHSSSLLPGGSPYVQTESQLGEFLARIDGILRHCIERMGCESCTLSECRTLIERESSPAVPFAPNAVHAL